jgi:hypothetical protein
VFAGEYEARQKVSERAAAYAAAAPPEAAQPPPISLADILSKLPPMPEGWKPGDPIPGLPALAAEQLAAAVAAKSVAAVDAAEPEEARKEEQEEREVRPVGMTRPVSAAFDFALNPDMEVMFEASESESGSEEDSD